jgi:hypothetical protein
MTIYLRTRGGTRSLGPLELIRSSQASVPSLHKRSGLLAHFLRFEKRFFELNKPG